MTKNQTSFQIKNPFKEIAKRYNKKVVNVTDKYQKKYKFEYNPNDSDHRYWNNEGDAFKHAYMQADLTFKFGDKIAAVPGYYHELQNLWNGDSTKETNMDLWNNKVGRQIGREVKDELMGKRKLPQNKLDDILAEKIMQKMNQGELITTPNEGRAFENKTNISKRWQQFYGDEKFKRLEPAKYDLSNQPTAGVNGSKDNTQVIVTYPQASSSDSSSDWLGQLGSTLSGIASVISTAVGGFTGNVGEVATGKIPSLHSGGTVVPKYKGGRNEMIAVLQGGETVRTEAQEKELQDAKTKELLEAYAPLVSGENNKNDPYAQIFGNNKSSSKDVKTPVLANKTRSDEEMIIAIVADAWKSNRSGFRNILRYQ